MGDSQKQSNGKPPLRPSTSKGESTSVLAPLIDDMIPPKEKRTQEKSSSRNLTPRPVGDSQKQSNGKPPLPPSNSKGESTSVMAPLIDDMIPPKEKQTQEESSSRSLTPRPGGFIKKLVDAEEEDKCDDDENNDETVIKDSMPYFGPPSYPANDIVDGEDHGWSPELRRVVSVVVSTVMLLAHGKSSCPPENLQWTYDFLMNVKDNYNRTPPNTRWLLNYIRKIKEPSTSQTS